MMLSLTLMKPPPTSQQPGMKKTCMQDRVPSRITVGDGTTYMVDVFGEQIIIYNAPLKSNTEYSIFTRYDIANELNPGEVSLIKSSDTLLNSYIFFCLCSYSLIGCFQK